MSMESEQKAELNLIHSAPRPNGFEVEHFAHEELEGAKQSLQADGYLTALAWIVTPTQIEIYALGFHDAEQKYDVYSRLVSRAHEIKADVIITLNDVRYIDNVTGVEYYEGMTSYPGRVSFEGAGEAILLTITGPGRAAKELRAKYHRIGDKLIFAPFEENTDVTVGMLGTWSKEVRSIQ